MHGRRAAPRASASEGSFGTQPAARGADERAEHELTLTLGLPEELIEQVAERLADLLAERAAEQAGSPWLSLPQAAAYLGFSRDKLYKLSAARAIPVRKKRDGQGLLFHRDELDQWVETAYQREGWLP
ncbi:MAG: helix-turn-helix domain-containing protein [Acidobacteriota bacterium]|nr:helix-turn-helix domain-containing protein [Acidobacteriota bacterium]MDE3129623.1 helix-turn-helix domain-containing protein [Acidobacteriota bacterium]